MRAEVILSEKELSKSSIKQVVEDIELDINEGLIDPLEVHIKAKYVAEAAKKIVEMSEPHALTEAMNYNDKDRSIKGVEFSVVNAADTLDLKTDKEYSDNYNRMKDRESKLREAYRMNKKEALLVIEGEQIPAPPIKKAGKQYIKTNFK